MFTIPEIRGKCAFVGVDYSLDGIVHCAEGLIGPEIAARIGKFFIFEKEFITEHAREHEFSLLLSA